MNCPRCNTVLAISITQGIEIDYCPSCRGVWLDKGELEKIIERSESFNPPYNRENNQYDYHDKHYDKHTDNRYGYGQHPKRKKGLLSELFDF